MPLKSAIFKNMKRSGANQAIRNITRLHLGRWQLRKALLETYSTTTARVVAFTLFLPMRIPGCQSFAERPSLMATTQVLELLEVAALYELGPPPPVVHALTRLFARPGVLGNQVETRPVSTPDPVLKLLFGTNDSWPSA